jgi:hypothetical protein
MTELYEKNPDAEALIMSQEVDPNVVDKYGIISLKPGTDDER